MAPSLSLHSCAVSFYHAAAGNCRSDQLCTGVDDSSDEGTGLKDVWISIAVFSAAVIAILAYILFTLPGGFPQIPAPSFSMIVLALYAGVNEEIINRAIPGAVMMRNKPTSRRITMMTVITSVIFGLVHLGNLAGGADVLYTILQTLNAIGIGLFFAGIYLRTGSILIPMVVHFLDDFIIFITQTMTTVANPNPTSPLDWVISACVMLLPFVFGVLLLRKKHHQAIINTWERIWTEQNAPAANIANE